MKSYQQYSNVFIKYVSVAGLETRNYDNNEIHNEFTGLLELMDYKHLEGSIFRFKLAILDNISDEQLDNEIKVKVVLLKNIAKVLNHIVYVQYESNKYNMSDVRYLCQLDLIYLLTFYDDEYEYKENFRIFSAYNEEYTI